MKANRSASTQAARADEQVDRVELKAALRRFRISDTFNCSGNELLASQNRFGSQAIDNAGEKTTRNRSTRQDLI